MEKILVKGVEVQFNDLLEEMQEKLYLERKTEFEKEAAKSQYDKIRRLIINEDEIDPVVLDEVFNIEVYGNEENLNLIWKHPKFEKNDDKRKILAESDYWKIRMISAEDEGSSSELLNQMLRNEIGDYGEYDVIKAIINNPNFKMDEKTREMLAEFNDWKIRMISAEDEGSSSEFLNQMLLNEIEDYGDYDVKKAIINNPNFKMDEKTRKTFAESDNYTIRMIPAKDEGSSKEFLENMFLKETDEDVLKAIEVNLLSKISKKSVALNVIQAGKIFNVLRNVKENKKKQPLAEYVKEIVDILS